MEELQAVADGAEEGVPPEDPALALAEALWTARGEESKWIGTLVSAGWTIECGPEMFGKTKRAKHAMGLQKSDHRYVVLASHTDEGKTALFYHSGNPSKMLDMAKQCLPLDKDTEIESDPALGSFTVTSSQKGKPVKFTSEENTKARKSEQIEFWGVQLEELKTSTPAQLEDRRQQEKARLAEEQRLEAIELHKAQENEKFAQVFREAKLDPKWEGKVMTDMVRTSCAGTMWATMSLPCEITDEWDDLADYVSQGKYRPARWQDFVNAYEELGGPGLESARSDIKFRAETKGAKGLNILLDALEIVADEGNEHGGGDEVFIRYNGLNHYAKRFFGNPSAVGEIAVLGELLLGLGARCDPDVADIPRRLLLIERDSWMWVDEPLADAKHHSQEARDREVQRHMYLAMKPGVIRQGHDSSSHKVGNLQLGRLIVALEEDGNRVRFTEGWVSIHSKSGIPLLVRQALKLRTATPMMSPEMAEADIEVIEQDDPEPEPQPEATDGGSEAAPEPVEPVVDMETVSAAEAHDEAMRIDAELQESALALQEAEAADKAREELELAMLLQAQEAKEMDEAAAKLQAALRGRQGRKHAKKKKKEKDEERIAREKEEAEIAAAEAAAEAALAAAAAAHAEEQKKLEEMQMAEKKARAAEKRRAKAERTVEIIGLTNSQQFNGLRGTILKFHEDIRRYDVPPRDISLATEILD